MKNLHKHGGKSSESLLDAHRILESIKISHGDVFMDAGCGDGYISLEASRMVGDDGQVLAVDVYQESLEILEKKVQDSGINNLQVIAADLTQNIPIDDDSVDLCLMANVLHGFIFNDELDQVISELIRIIKSDGKFAVVEFKKIEGTPGPELSHRITSDEVKDSLSRFGFSFEYEVEVGPYHYAVVMSIN